MAGRRRQSSRPEPVPAAPPTGAAQPEALPEAAPQLATPLETATANARAFEVLVGKMEQELNEARIKLLKWQGAAEFLASLEHGDGPSNGEDKEKTLADGLHKETSQ